MLDFFARNKAFIIGILVTVVIFSGGIYLSSRGSSGPDSTKISMNILAPDSAQKTSGFVNNNYLPATSSATISLVEFGDYECPACGTYSPFVKRLLTELPGKINFVFRDYPLSQHKNANISSYAAEAAGLQGKFWPMHDMLFDNQNAWSNLPDPKSVFVTYAQNLGLDINKFQNDINSDAVKKVVEQGTNDGNLVKLDATPTFYLNGVKMNLIGTYDEFKNLVTSAK